MQNFAVCGVAFAHMCAQACRCMLVNLGGTIWEGHKGTERG